MVCSFYPDATSQTSRSSSSLVLGLDDVARGTPTRSLGIEDDYEDDWCATAFLKAFPFRPSRIRSASIPC
jgi:hypothetical protein